MQEQAVINTGTGLRGLSPFWAQLFFLIAALCLSVCAQAKPENGKTYENWTVRCEKTEQSETERCYIFQVLTLREGGQRILHIAVGYLPDMQDPVVLLTLPLGISLPPGAKIQIDDNEALRFNIERCETNGCRAGFSLNEENLNQFKKGLEARIIFHDGARRPISFPLSLKGFTAGLSALR